MTKFVFCPDTHVGWEKKNGKLQTLHDVEAIGAMMEFVKDFQPQIFIAGGDNLDCGPVSHWLNHKKASVADLDLRKDCKEYSRLILEPLKKIKSITDKRWMIGNHEMWLEQAVEEKPGLKGVLDVTNLLDLDGWQIVEAGGVTRVGHLRFIHGDTLPNAKNVAAVAVERNNCSLAFGHFHTKQEFTKHTMIEQAPMVGIAVPGLCKTNPKYLENRPNQWIQGFMFGYVLPNGNFTYYVPTIIDGKFVGGNGKVYG